MNYAFVSGAGGILGYAYCVQMAKMGYNLILTSRSQQKLQNTADKLKCKYDINILTFACDFTDMAQIEKLQQFITQSNAILDYAINNAGVDYEGDFSSITQQQVSNIITTNVTATALLTHFFINNNPQEHRLRIINVASLGGFFSIPLKATYTASKSFIINLSISLNTELKAKNISVTAICPGGIATTQYEKYSILSQGAIGLATTKKPSFIAKKSIQRADASRAQYIPSFINNYMLTLSRPFGLRVTSKILFWRWKKTRAKVIELQKTISPELLELYFIKNNKIDSEK